jgi:hypothetical protein
MGNKLIAKLRDGQELNLGIDLSVRVKTESAVAFQNDLKQILEDLGIADRVEVAEG